MFWQHHFFYPNIEYKFVEKLDYIDRNQPRAENHANNDIRENKE